MVLCSALLGCITYGQPVVEVGVSVPLPAVVASVEIHVESDFYEPLAPDGDWVIIGSYGRCWRPGHVARDWRPYCNGNWEFTDAGWYWVSDEPWAWATKEPTQPKADKQEKPAASEKGGSNPADKDRDNKGKE
jgi:hypothetical protein